MIGILSVTYKEPFESSALYKSFKEIPSKDKTEYKIFNFYNSSEVNQIEEHQEYTEQKTTENGGLAMGFNYGIDFFKSFSDVDHLLFLNSDCILNPDILQQYTRMMKTGCADFYFPKLFCKNKLISPFRKPGFNYDFYIIAWTMVKKSNLENFRFDIRFWLDGIDYDFSVWFKDRELLGKPMEATLIHDLSVISNYKGTQDWRILNIYKSEKIFLSKGFNFILIKGIIRALLNSRIRLALTLTKLF